MKSWFKKCLLLLLILLVLLAALKAYAGYVPEGNRAVREYDGEPHFGEYSGEEAFALGYREDGVLVFQNPEKAISRMRWEFLDVIWYINTHFSLMMPLSRWSYAGYTAYGSQIPSDQGHISEKGVLLAQMLDIYENSFSR